MNTVLSRGTYRLEIGVSAGAGKVKTLPNRTTLHRRTTTTYSLKRPSSRQMFSEVKKKFGFFPFSLRQLEDEKNAKVGVVECVRGNVMRQYEVVGDKDGANVGRIFSTVGTCITFRPFPITRLWKRFSI